MKYSESENKMENNTGSHMIKLPEEKRKERKDEEK